MKKLQLQTIAVIVGLLFSLAAGAQNNETAKGTNKLAPCHGIWRFSWRSAPSHRTYGTMRRYMS
jgi:hypothetical protein